MMKNAGRFEHDLEDQINQRRYPEENDHEQPEGKRERDLAEMKTCRCRYIEVEVGVVDVMKAPEERDAVHRVVPPVIRPIHQQKRHDSRGDSRQLDPVEQANSVALRPGGVRERDRHQGEPKNHERRNRHHEIPHQPWQHGEMPAPQRIFPLEKQQEREEAPQNRTAHIIEQRDWLHHGS